MEAIGDQVAEFGGPTAVLTRAGSSPAGGPNVDDDGSDPSLAGHLRAVPDKPAAGDAGPDRIGSPAAGYAGPEDIAPLGPGRGARLDSPRSLAGVGPADEPLSLPETLSLPGVGMLLAAAAAAAPTNLAAADYVEAANFAGHVEDLSRSVEYLQVLAAGAVDRTRTQAIAAADAARAGRSRAGRGWVTGWDNGVETLNETDAAWPSSPEPDRSTLSGSTHPASTTTGSGTRSPAPDGPVADAGTGTGRCARVVSSPADDGCANTAEFLRQRLRIGKSEAHRRLALAADILPATTLTGDTIPAPRGHLAAALTPTPDTIDTADTADTDTATATAGTVTAPGHGPGAAGPAVSSRAGTLISLTLNRLQPLTTAKTLALIEENLTTTAATADPDFLARLARRWAETIDADGTEPTEETLRHTQGAFIRKPRHGLHHLEIFATTDQYEHLITVMNTATNPRTTGTDTHTGTATRQDGWRDADVDLDRRTRAQKQLDGLVGATKIALATNTLPSTGGNRPQIIATINHHDLLPHHRNNLNGTGTAAGNNGTGPAAGANAPTGRRAPAGTGTGNFAFTGPVNAATLRKIACDADIIPAILGTHGEILDLGRKTRLFTPTQRLALTARDQGCAFPHCTIPAPWCEAHHITYWSHGGPTTINNGVLLCSGHHHLIHKEQWTITTTNDTPWFTPPKHIDPHQKPQQNHYFKPPPPPRPALEQTPGCGRSEPLCQNP